MKFAILIAAVGGVFLSAACGKPAEPGATATTSASGAGAAGGAEAATPTCLQPDTTAALPPGATFARRDDFCHIVLSDGPAAVIENYYSADAPPMLPDDAKGDVGQVFTRYLVNDPDAYLWEYKDMNQAGKDEGRLGYHLKVRLAKGPRALDCKTERGTFATEAQARKLLEACRTLRLSEPDVRR